MQGMELIRTCDAARICGVTRVTIHDWICQGKLAVAAHTPYGRLLSRADVERYAEQRRQQKEHAA